MSVSVIIPYRKREEISERALAFVRARYAELHPEWQVVLGNCRGAWSKGKAIASALRKAEGDRLVIADADSFTEPGPLESAVESLEEFQWSVPHKTVIRLDADSSERVLGGATPIAKGLARPRYRGTIGGGLIVVRRSLYDELGGIDPRFKGWGGEDLTFGWMLLLLGGPFMRYGGYLWHLWHQPETTNLRGSEASEALVAEYRAVSSEPDGMRALIEARLADGAPDKAPHDDGGVAAGGLKD